MEHPAWQQQQQQQQQDAAAMQTAATPPLAPPGLVLPDPMDRVPSPALSGQVAEAFPQSRTGSPRRMGGMAMAEDGAQTLGMRGTWFVLATLLATSQVLLIHNLAPSEPRERAVATATPLLQTALALVMLTPVLACLRRGATGAPAKLESSSLQFNLTVLLATSHVATHLSHSFNQWPFWFDLLGAVFLIAMLFRPSGAPLQRQLLELTIMRAPIPTNANSNNSNDGDGMLPMTSQTEPIMITERTLTLTPQAALVLSSLSGIVAGAQGLPSGWLAIFFGFLESCMRAFMLVRMAREIAARDMRGIDLLAVVALPAGGLIAFVGLHLEIFFAPVNPLYGITFTSLTLFLLGTAFTGAYLVFSFLLMDESLPLVMATGLWPTLLSTLSGSLFNSPDSVLRFHESIRSFLGTVMLSLGLTLLVLDRAPMPLTDLTLSKSAKPLYRAEALFVLGLMATCVVLALVYPAGQVHIL